ncbi:signal transduction histidine kinase, putative [Babesia ovata]|uniref:Signal transduction histidine kinase, putative n=1 Tax=Babesia ovata TaxID=189622 RepID=A0A2H6KCR3_9APIC|nr:signal transduction histidine kinase, putative [Babesia ovata]GBE60790.1 signal transduction histidine kinase, putative [Babesia ovata]
MSKPSDNSDVVSRMNTDSAIRVPNEAPAENSLPHDDVESGSVSDSNASEGERSGFSAVHWLLVTLSIVFALLLLLFILQRTYGRLDDGMYLSIRRIDSGHSLRTAEP